MFGSQSRRVTLLTSTHWKPCTMLNRNDVSMSHLPRNAAYCETLSIFVSHVSAWSNVMSGMQSKQTYWHIYSTIYHCYHLNECERKSKICWCLLQMDVITEIIYDFLDARSRCSRPCSWTCSVCSDMLQPLNQAILWHDRLAESELKSTSISQSKARWGVRTIWKETRSLLYNTTRGPIYIYQGSLSGILQQIRCACRLFRDVILS